MMSKIVAAALATAAMFVAPVHAQERTEAGVLSCAVAGGVGFVFGSTRQLACTFESSTGLRENYLGEIRRFGIDVGVTAESAIIWAVFAPTVELSPWALAGTYAGVSAEATVGLGVGANAMVGGSQSTVVLQPLSVSGQAGLNLAAGVAEIHLVPAG